VNAHDELLQQLKGSVRERRARRFARHRGMVVALAGTVVLGGGAATAATGVLPLSGGDRHATARELAADATRATADQPACALPDARRAAPVVGVPVDPAARPLLMGSRDPEAERLAARRGFAGAIVAGSARVVALPGGHRVLLFAGIRSGGGPADAGACVSARLAWLAAHAPRDRRAAAEAIVRGSRDTSEDLQWLNLVLLRGQGGDYAGTATPLDGRPLPTGVLMFGSGDYTGIAVPGARAVTVDGRALHRRFAVRSRVFVVTVPRTGTGRLTLRQRAADGRVLAGQVLRG
jgi:hypothetical protein